MKKYRVWLANEVIDIEAESVRTEGNYELDIKGQQPCVAFIVGSNRVAMFAIKNIAGWKEIK
jgi:hypothetical protein